jgi:dihydroorotase-like cyclic amidohydrolase
VYDLIIRDATIVSSAGRQVADVAIRDGRIAYVGPRPPRRARREISAIGKFLMPGVIDTAVQFDPNGDPQIWERESKAAITGGVTTVVSLPGGDHPVVDRQSAKRRADVAGRRSWVNWGLWGAATRSNRDELEKAVNDGLIVGSLAYMSDAVDADVGLDTEALPSWLDAPGVLAVQLEVGSDTAEEAEPVLAAARENCRPIHLIHLSTAAELSMIDPVRGDVHVTASCTPHHLFLSTEEDDAIVTRPPVRPEHDRRTLWTAVKRGRLDCVASDHHPLSQTEGVPGSELMFPLMLSAVKYGRLSLELLVSLCSESPARILGLENKGRIEKGADADLVLFSEGEVARVGETDLMSGAGWSPYVDREAAPKPDLVIVNGEIAAMRGRLVAEEPKGRPIVAQA